MASINVGCTSRSLYASSGPKAESVPTNNGAQDPVAPGEVRQGPSYSPNRLATLQEWSVQGCKRAEHKTYSPLYDRWFTRTTLRAFHYFRARRDEIRFAFDPPKFVDNITVQRISEFELLGA